MVMATTGGGHPGMPVIPQPRQAATMPGQMSALSAATAPPAAPNYAAQYQQALQQAQSGIHQQLGADLGYIQSQQNAAGQALGQLPGGVNQAYNQAQGSLGSAESAITAAQQKSGVGSLMPLQSYMAPVSAAMEGSRAGALSNVPLLNIGIQQQANQQRASALQGAAGDQQAITMQQMQFLQSQQAAQQAQQAQAALAQQAQQNNQANALQQYGYNQKLQDDPNRNFGPSASAGTSPLLDPKTGLPTGFTADQLTTASKSPQYQRAAAELNNAPNGSPERQMIWHQMQNVYAKQPAILKALDDFFFGGSPPPDVPTPASKGPNWYENLDMGSSKKGKGYQGTTSAAQGTAVANYLNRK